MSATRRDRRKLLYYLDCAMNLAAKLNKIDAVRWSARARWVADLYHAREGAHQQLDALEEVAGEIEKLPEASDGDGEGGR